MISSSPQQSTTTDTLYERDYYRWLLHTAAQLRAGELEQLDIDNLLEEIEDMGRREKRALESNLRILLLHLLKWKYQAQQRSGSWRGSIVEHRIRIRKALKDSPSLKHVLTEVFPEAYQDARVLANSETSLAKDIFPVNCEWELQDILKEEWLPD